MKTTIIISSIIIVLLAVGGSVLFFRQGGEAEEETSFTEEENTMANNGFGEFAQEDPGIGMEEQEPEWFNVEDDGVVVGDGPLTEEESEEEAKEVTISMDESGFTPSTVTVAAGTTVTFINNGQGLRWPASDPHPTHHILPEFDSKRGLATGESYSFTFTQPGSWGMHDHLDAAVTGTVIVE